MILISYALNAQERKKTWDYPVKPGMEEWQHFKSIDEMYKACQIPENILKTLDTESLAQICMDYPAPLVLIIYNSPQAGFSSFHSNFNGIRELFRRKDIGKYLLKKYTNMSFADFNPLWPIEKQGDFSFKYQFVETIIAQPQVIQSLDATDRKLLLKEVIKKFDMKNSRTDLFGGNSLVINAWIMARILHSENKFSTKYTNKSEIEMSLESGQLVDYDIQCIFQQAKKYTNE